MKKKIDFNKTAKKIEGISNTVETIMRNRLIIAFFLIVDGITFLLNPDTTLSGMTKNIMLLIIFAAFSIFITNLAAKKKDKKTIIISVVIIVLGIFFYFYPDLIAAYLQLLLALFIIYDGASNIISSLHFNGRLSKWSKAVIKKSGKLFESKKPTKSKLVEVEKFKEVDSSVNQNLAEQKEKLITPLQNITKKTSKSLVLYTIINSISIIFGITLLIYPNASMMIWGMIFLYTGLVNLLTSIKSMHLFKKIKEKRFKEILFDSSKNQPEKH